MKNVILITIDSLRAGHLSCLGYHRKTTPNIDNLAKKGVLFTNAISCGPDTPTSVIPLLTSTYVLTYYMASGGVDKLRTSVEEFDRMKTLILEVLQRQGTTITDVLKGYGYATAAFHSNPFLSRYYNFGRGFDHFDDSFSFLGLKRYSIKRKITGILEKSPKLYDLVWYVYKNVYDKLKSDSRVHGDDVPFERGEVLNKKVISWLEQHEENFFVWLHYMDVHFPYKPPKEFQFDSPSKSLSSVEISNLNYKMLTSSEEMSKDEIKEIIDLYDGGIKYTDHIIKSLLDKLNEMNILDDTILIITADHGDEFGDHGDFAHYQAKLYDELIRVPLIICHSEHKNIRIDEPVSLLDVSPTILDLLGIPAVESFQGRSLIPIIMGERKSSGVVSESLLKGKRNVSYRTNEWKYILNEVDSRHEFYDISNDPKEGNNLYEKERERAKEFELKIMEHIRKQEKRVSGLTDEKEKIKKKLKELRHIDRI